MIRLPDFELDGDKQVGMVEEIALELSEGWDQRRHDPEQHVPFTRLVGAVVRLVVTLGVAAPPERPVERTPRARRVSPRAERRRRLRESLKESD